MVTSGNQNFKFIHAFEFTDTRNYNLQPSRQCAQSVKSYLVSVYHIPPSCLYIAAYGEKQPLRGDLYHRRDAALLRNIC
ncbi:OmpA family protein [Candidatus Venteria ishoeyi]|uniref:OmpA-like domain-containing protein n=1 Tax=Candidatus Venteria ishoeyi TaxID=1899563 RepID=A0A1H6FCI0_9GAMM|nr:OmpA family protein [Candidatus Venteria ishoeyi]MDM8544961.1 OmpA family protein [Candidatus Venteria ishoeyi]SEH07778.1 Uncharacterised protein [Candidatus Venteria ishoeyi]